MEAQPHEFSTLPPWISDILSECPVYRGDTWKNLQVINTVISKWNTRMKIEMDVSELRQNYLMQHPDQFNHTESNFTFYYDESNNIRKLSLTENGMNVGRTGNFVLAGILNIKKDKDTNFDEVIDKLNLQKTTNELKLKHIGKGHFLDLLNSKKLSILLNWLADNDLFIHYFNLNVFFWSIVDIVDSIMENLPFDQGLFFKPNHMVVKSDFYKVIKSHELEFLTELKKFNYPNIKKNKIHEFSEFLINFISESSDVLNDERKYLLNKFFEQAINKDELFFIMHNDDDILIDSFFNFYIQRVYLFTNSLHIFDTETTVEKKIEKWIFMDSGETISNYEFKDSKSDRAIQISDVLAGLLGKYFSFIEKTDFDELKSIKSSLKTQQTSNLNLLCQLIEKSNSFCEGFFINIVCEDEYLKHNFFMAINN